MVKIRKLLINSKPKNDIEAGLKRMYLRRIQEMFRRVTTMESTFNVFDEVFHGLSQASLINENLHSFYESFLTISSYYQHSQAGRGSLVAQLLKDLGNSEKMEFEFTLNKLPQLLDQNIKLEESELTTQKFDIINKNKGNISFCELKMKVYSGCTAGRIELVEKFNKFTKLITTNKNFRNCIKNAKIKNIFLIGGILFDIQGEPATKQKDKQWGICYNGLIRGKKDIVKTLEDSKIKYELNENDANEKAFVIKFNINDIGVSIVAVYGNEVIKSLFAGEHRHDIKYFKKQLEDMLYDDLWLGQIITLSERTVLDQNFKKNKKLNNYVTTIIKNKELISEVKKFQTDKSEKALKSIVSTIIYNVKKLDKSWLEIKPIPAELIIKSVGESYDISYYVGDIVQFLACNDVVKEISKDSEKINTKVLTDF